MVNPFIVVPFLTWAITQFAKFCLAAFRGNVDFKYLYASGGMPSVHAAVVVSLATTALAQQGINSPIFGLAVIFAAIVMYDSFGVRRSSGEQAHAINLIMESLTEDRIALRQPQNRLREILGHRPLEVSVGAAIGLVLGGLFNIDKLGPFFAWLSQPLSQLGLIVLAGVAALLLVGGLALRIIYLRSYRGIEVAQRWVGRSYSILAILSVLGLLVGGLGYEHVDAARWIVWPLLLAILLAFAVIIMTNTYIRRVMPALAAFQAQQDKDRWLPEKKRRKKRR